MVLLCVGPSLFGYFVFLGFLDGFACGAAQSLLVTLSPSLSLYLFILDCTRLIRKMGVDTIVVSPLFVGTACATRSSTGPHRVSKGTSGQTVLWKKTKVYIWIIHN
jgi:hypothetical protein